ncbi:MAG: exopolysaccharide biosynthesis polyprenyl glycosylphosphotransferase, partial [Sulfuricaulis sp.]|nr:exopolysaccharide biosynthesis polyprenyl glycosylphosphotransferase [Sulfuricaulis sp.]
AGTLAQLIELGKTRKIDWILLTLPPTAEQRVLSMVQRLKALSVPIGLCPQHVGLTVPYRTIDYVGGSVPVSLLADRPIKRWEAVVKGGEDFLIGGIATLLLLPVLAIVALAIKLDNPGPVIFKQRRHAFNNHEFDIYKFRTMRWNPAAATENLRQTSRHDDRVTRVGRFLRASSLDELPQLFNVLKGDMSLVGPRPHAVNMRTEDRLGHEITGLYAHRHRVKPGITGWSQVNGSRGAVDTTAQLRRRVELDLHYIENWSVLLDLKILALTCREVIKRTNAY